MPAHQAAAAIPLNHIMSPLAMYRVLVVVHFAVLLPFADAQGCHKASIATPSAMWKIKFQVPSRQEKTTEQSRSPIQGKRSANATFRPRARASTTPTGGTVWRARVGGCPVTPCPSGRSARHRAR